MISPDEQLRMLDTFELKTIKHRTITEARRDLLLAIPAPRYLVTHVRPESEIIFLTGPTGVGKTTVLRSVERWYLGLAAAEAAQHADYRPHVSWEAPPQVSSVYPTRDLMAAGLRAMDEPLATRKIEIPPPGGLTSRRDVLSSQGRDSVASLRSALESSFEHRHTGLAQIDEIQHMAVPNPPGIDPRLEPTRLARRQGVARNASRRTNLDFLKAFVNTSRVTILGAGSYDLTLFRGLNGQLNRRCRWIHFPAYDIESTEDQAEFKDAVLTLENALPIEHFDLVAQTEWLMLRSVGCVGNLKKWLHRGLQLVLFDGRSRVTRRDLERTMWSAEDLRAMAEDIRWGRAHFVESASAEQDLRQLLSTPAGTAARAPRDLAISAMIAARKPKPKARVTANRRPFERAPRRDPIGTDN
jgi:AAA domain